VRRRRLLTTATAVVALAGTAVVVPGLSSGAATRVQPLPAQRMQQVLQADGDVTDGVLSVEMSRSDLHARGGSPAVRFVDGFQLQHDLTFQPLPGGRALFNGDLALRPSELQPVIDAIIANGLTFQAEHQHLYDISPMVWFIHFRGTGDPVQLARRVHAVIAVTGTPLPQSSPAHPTTPLPAARLASVLGGDATIGENGVVTVSVNRTDRITLAGHAIRPELNIATTVQFEPLGGGRAAVVPDFSMTASEVMPVTQTMRALGWLDGCLYNQETAESPQLYFSHMFRTGDAVTLARQVRAGLNHTASER
jgi:hypothetical protein